MISCLVPGWGLVLLSVHTDCSWELSALPLLPGHPAMAFWLLALGGHSWPSAFLAPVQMTLNRPQREFSVTTWLLQSYGNVPGPPSCWEGCGGSLRPSSFQTYPVTLPSCSPFSSHLPPACSQAASCLGFRSEVWQSSPCLQSFNLAILEKNRNIAILVFILHNADLKVFGIGFIIRSTPHSNNPSRP